MLQTGNPLVAQFSLILPNGATADVEFGPDTSYGFETSAEPAPPRGGRVIIFVAGMRAATTYHMRCRVHLSSTKEIVGPDHTFTTGAVAAERLPQISVTHTPGSAPSQGVELFSLTGGTTNQLRAVVTDIEGNLIWYYDFGPVSPIDAPEPIKLIPNGHFLIVVTGPVENSLREVDLAGNTVREITRDQLTQKLGAHGFSLVQNGFHHDVAVLPNGHVVLLVFEQRVFTDLPGFPGQTTVVGDALVDLDPNWNPVWTWSTFDHLDVNRHPMQFPDWTHCNAIVYSPSDGNLVLSSRHQYWLMKIDYRDGYGTGDILWRFGPQGDFTLVNGGIADWNYAQHDPVFMSGSSVGIFPLALFDNGDNRPVDAQGDPCGPTTAACYTRPVVFEINEFAKTATILWQDKLSVFSFCCGSIDATPNGDMEFDIASLSRSPVISRVQEVTYTGNPELVWQMDVDGQLAYRATRLSSLYPGVEW